ncbi:MAG: ABC transporter ATP-binding protein, partial [Anaerolineae bacterium]|nr:ABC transporter ATP-binding protein [Anaerolineae bacterium]
AAAPAPADPPPADGPPLLLDIRDVSYRYGSFQALSHVSLTAQPGELVALLGRNGAGKSTLLKCIAGWTRFTEGEIDIKGISVGRQERDIREHVVLLPDTPPFYTELTAWEHLQFAAQAHGYEDWEDEAEELLERYGLLVNKEAFPFTFSRGMRYKLALCIALLIEPALLLLDEPLGPLDPVSADDLWHQLHRHRADGMTILLSSHQLPPEAHPDRYVIMEGGELLLAGTPDELRQVLHISGDLTLDALLRAALQQRRDRHEARHG